MVTVEVPLVTPDGKPSLRMCVLFLEMVPPDPEATKTQQTPNLRKKVVKKVPFLGFDPNKT